MTDLPPIQDDSDLPPLGRDPLREDGRRGKPVSFYLAIFLGLLLLVSAGLNLVLVAVSFVGSATSGLGGLDDSAYDIVSVAGDLDSEARVLRIPIQGAIAEQSSPLIGGAGGSVSSVERALHFAARNESIKGILLDINSPGGGVTASDQIYQLLTDFRHEHPGKPIVALFGDLAASGGYYVAMAADYIVAHPTTTTGSIGVIMSQYNVAEAAEAIGVREVAIVSGPNKNLLSPFHGVDEGQRAILQSIVDDLYDRFVDVVDQGRQELDLAQVRRLADGRVYSARQALDEKLVDEVGYQAAAVAKLRELCDESSIHVVEQRKQPSFTDLLMGASAQSPLEGLVGSALSSAMSPSFLYWWPGAR